MSLLKNVKSSKIPFLTRLFAIMPSRSPGKRGKYNPARGFTSLVMNFAALENKGQPMWYASDTPLPSGIDALVYSGQSDPKTVLSMENHLKYKGVSLNVMLAYYGGHKMRVLQAVPLYTDWTLPYAAIPSYFLNAWTPDNTDTNVPGIGRHSPAAVGTGTEDTDIYVQPADFLKIRSIVLGYDVPSRLLSKIGLNDATLRLQVDNPRHLWRKNKVGVDPETRSLRDPSACMLGVNFNL
jgi:hypothetical protein